MCRRIREWTEEGDRIADDLFEIRTRNMSVKDLQDYRDCLTKLNWHTSTSIVVVLFLMAIAILSLSVMNDLVMPIKDLNTKIALLMGFCIPLLIMLFGINGKNVRKITDLIEKRLTEGKE